jgi:hypothetical protein
MQTNWKKVLEMLFNYTEKILGTFDWIPDRLTSPSVLNPNKK